MTASRLPLNRRDFMRAGAAVGAAAGLAATGAPLPARASAPLTGPLVPAVRRIRLGEIEVTTILDGAVSLPGPHPIFGEDQPAEAVEQLASANLLPPTRMQISFTPTIVNTGRELVLFDTGYGASQRPNAGQLQTQLATAGYRPQDIDIVALTHFHPDHVGGLIEAGQPAFPNARYVAPAREYDFWTDDRLATHERLAGGHQLTLATIGRLAEHCRFIKDGDSVASGITAMAAFGHTPGHTAYHIESDGKQLVITGDCANHFVISLQQPDWHVRFDMDKQAAADTRRQIFGMLAADRVAFIGYHMPSPALGYVEAHGTGFRYVPSSYQFDL